MTTDLLTRDPNDTGEIPTAETTHNLAPYVVGGPVLRRPDAVTALLVTYTVTGETFNPGHPNPDPLPPPPPPTPSDVWQAEPAPRYLGRHRRPSRWDWLTVPLAMAVQRIGRAL